MDYSTFISRMEKTHGNRYTVAAQFETIRTCEKVSLNCEKHGPFSITVSAFLRGQRCKRCGLEYRSARRLDTLEGFISKARKKHGDWYDYSKTNYVFNTTPVIIRCPKHGDFEQTPNSHLQGRGCYHCGNERKSSDTRYTTEDFIKVARKTHGDRYDYSLVEYRHEKHKVDVICRRHGIFKAIPNKHQQGSGCPVCARSISSLEMELCQWLTDNDIDFIRRDRKTLLGNREIDVLLPDYSIGIEMDGLYWHREEKFGRNGHLNKTEEAATKGIRLIHIFEDEWRFKTDIVKNRLSAILGLNKDRVFARKLNVRDISSADAKIFLDQHHLQGGGTRGAVNLGLFLKEGLIGVATFIRTRFEYREGAYELLRFATSRQIVGGFSKLIAAFCRKVPEAKILISYADRRWSEGGVYQKNGFEFKGYSKPAYYWCKQTRRINRQNMQKHKLQKLLVNFDPAKTEKENCEANGYWRVFDCGASKWELVLG